MPAVTALSVFDEARAVYLNDVSVTSYTNTILLPFLKSAYEDFRNECALNGISQEYRRASPVTIALGAVIYGTLPTDLLLPISLEERTSGSTDLYTPMQEVRFLPEVQQGPSLIYWNWFDSLINFVGATQANQVRLTYYWDFTPDAVTTGTLDLRANGRAYLSARLSAKVKLFIEQMQTEAAAMNQVAEEQLSKIIGIMVRNRQSVPVRQVPFGRRSSWSF